MTKRILKHDKDIPEPASIDRYGLTFSGIAPVLCLLLLALVVHFVSYGMDLARYEAQVSASLDDGNLGADVDRRLNNEALADNLQRKLFVGVLLGQMLKESDPERRESVGSVICDEFGLLDDDVAYFLNLGFRERMRNADLACLRAGFGDLDAGGFEGLFDGRPSVGSEEYWQDISMVPLNADPLGLDVPERAVEVGDDEVLWFYFAAPRDGRHTFLAEGQFGAFDSVMALYSREAGRLIFMEFNDDASGLDPSITVFLEAGVTYYVGIAGYSGGSGLANVTVKAGGLFEIL